MAGYWDALARRYDRVTLTLNRSLPAAAQAAAQAAAGAGDALEIAAGTGLMSVPLAEAVGHLTVTDPAEAMRGVLQHRLAARDNTTIADADALALPFEAEAFDVVLIGNLLHLLPEPAAALREARRVLRPGGTLLAPTFCHGHGIVAQATSRLLGLVGGLSVATRFQGEDLDALIAESGFTVREARWFGGWLPLRLVVATAA